MEKHFNSFCKKTLELYLSVLYNDHRFLYMPRINIKFNSDNNNKKKLKFTEITHISKLSSISVLLFISLCIAKEQNVYAT